MFNYRLRLYGFIIPLLLALAACIMQPGSYSRITSNGSEKMYRYEEGGKKTLVYEVDAAGKLTVYDPNDKQAQQRLAQQKQQVESEQKRSARMEKIRQAPKRNQNDPISVYFLPIESEVEMSDKQKQDIFDYFKKQLEGDPVIRLMDNAKSRSGKMRQAASFLKNASSGRPTSDVDLRIKVSTETVYGFTKDRKPAEAKAMVFKATVTGNWLPATQKAEESGTLFQLPDATRKLSEKIKKLIKDEIGPTIPADRSL